MCGRYLPYDDDHDFKGSDKGNVLIRQDYSVKASYINGYRITHRVV